MGKGVKIGILLVALAFLLLGGYLLYSNWKISIMRIPPKAPSSLVVKPISATELSIIWKDNSNNELGFMLYRDGKRVAELPENTTRYKNIGLKPGTTHTYEIKSYNQAGESDVIVCSGKTLNPPIIVWLDKIGVHENGEEGEIFREFSLLGEPSQGEVQVGLVVSDGKNTVQTRLPNKGSYKLKQDEVIQARSLLFETQEVGDYLRFYAVSYEDDGGLGEQLIYKALDLVTGSYIGMPTSILLTLSGVDFAKIYAEIFGAEDDYLGSYVSEWTYDDNWGVGDYIDIKCKKDDGDVGLRLWFRVMCPVYNYDSEKSL